jgi:NAD(P)-dependent dehydrogenase (short-subunit alcohol dehydrogenase family)
MKRAKNIVITGSSRGFGFALAREFLEAGCCVMLSGKSHQNLAQAVDKLKGYGGRVFSAACDVTNYADVQRLWQEAEERLPAVDVWINNAGIGQESVSVWEIPPETMKAIIETNVTGLIYGSRVAFLGMSAQGHGQIFNMEGFGSDGRHMNNLSLYGTTKSAVRYFTHGLAKEAGRSGVLVGTLSPGMMACDFVLEPMRKDQERSARSLRILNIIADRPETVARFLVPRILANKKQGAHFRWLTGRKLFRRFLTAPFVKRDIIRL